MDLIDDARSLQEDLVRLRRELHREPEIGLDLPRTQERVLDELAGLPLEIGTGTRTTSVTAVLRGGLRTEADPSTVLLRADMDALPVVEQTGLEFASTNGAMHGCGHDLHTSALVGAARMLCAHRERLAGDVVFMFQPGEEGWHGGKIMVDEGVLDASGRRPDAAYALHVMSGGKPQGRFFAKPGTFLAASYKLAVTVRGAGGHGSSPHTARDPIVAAAEMITSLQTMVTRTFDVFDPVVITVANMRAGTRHNIIPDDAHFEATVRCYSPETFDRVPGEIRRVLEGIASAHRVQVEHACDPEFPLTINDENETAFAAAVVSDLMGEDRYETVRHPLSGSEDFSYVLGEIPGAFVSLGACVPGMAPSDAPMNHSPRAQFDDAVLGDAAAIYAGLAARRLNDAATSLKVVAEGALS
jgi:hippurate hydrolase